MKDTVLLA